MQIDKLDNEDAENQGEQTSSIGWDEEQSG